MKSNDVLTETLESRKRILAYEWMSTRDFYVELYNSLADVLTPVQYTALHRLVDVTESLAIAEQEARSAGLTLDTAYQLYLEEKE